MGIHPGMLIFALFDGGLAFLIVFCLVKAHFKKEMLGRSLGTILGMIIFSIYIALFVLFNTPGVFVRPDLKWIVYLAPIVLFVLLTVLVLLSQPPKKRDLEDTDLEKENTETEEAGEN